MLYPRTERQQHFIDVASGLIPALRERAAQHDRDGSFPHENFADIRRSVCLPWWSRRSSVAGAPTCSNRP